MLVPAYRALGWTGSSGPDAVRKLSCTTTSCLIHVLEFSSFDCCLYDSLQARKAKDLMHMKRMQNRHWQQLGIKANKLRGNTHFRDRNGMC